jgi:hypothetical protein
MISERRPRQTALDAAAGLEIHSIANALDKNRFSIDDIALPRQSPPP